jgi:hypothetical protein
MGIELRKGRLFNAQGDAQAPRVVLVNEAFAARYLKGSDAVGRRLDSATRSLVHPKSSASSPTS